jgi:transcription antitermination factor NusG
MTIWFAAKVSPQKEFACEEILTRRGFRCFVPREGKWKTASRRKKEKRFVEYPMLRSYVFIASAGALPWDELARINVINGFVSVNGDGYPTAISDKAMAGLQQISGGYVPNRKSVNTHKALRPGDTAEISHGPFFGQLVTITGLSGEKARVMLELFGVKREIQVSIRTLEAA